MLLLIGMSAFQAELYEANSLGQMGIGLELIKRIAPKKGSKILDLGCGTGRLTEAIAEIVGPDSKVVAVDPDTERIKIAKERHVAENIHYGEGDAEHFPEDDYDLIFSNYVLHWVKNKEIVFQQAKKYLKKDGVLAFAMPTKQKNSEDVEATKKTLSQEFREDLQMNYHYMDSTDLHTFASTYGFEIQHFSIEKTNFTFESVHNIVDFLRANSPGKLFDESHFDIEAMKEYYCGNLYVFSNPILIAVLKKL